MKANTPTESRSRLAVGMKWKCVCYVAVAWYSFKHNVQGFLLQSQVESYPAPILSELETHFQMSAERLVWVVAEAGLAA